MAKDKDTKAVQKALIKESESTTSTGLGNVIPDINAKRAARWTGDPLASVMELLAAQGQMKPEDLTKYKGGKMTREEATAMWTEMTSRKKVESAKLWDKQLNKHLKG